MSSQVVLSFDEKRILIQFKDWVISQPQFVNPVIDSKFLLRFLRCRKFNLDEACQVYKKYLKVRDAFPYCYKKLDINDPTLLDLMTRGYMFPLRERDSQGRVVVFGRSAIFNQKYGHRPTDLFRAIIMTFETLLNDEDNQENGIVYIFDQEGVGLSEVTYVGVFEMQKLARSGEKALPVKHKEVHWLNLPPLIMTCFYFISSFLTEKLRKRLFLHKNLKSLHDVICPHILPLEYGGTVPWKEMANDWVEKLQENRENLMAMDRMAYDENRKEKQRLLSKGLKKSLSV